MTLFRSESGRIESEYTAVNLISLASFSAKDELGFGASLTSLCHTSSRFSSRTMRRKLLSRYSRLLSVRFQITILSIDRELFRFTSHHGFSEASVCVVDFAAS